MRLKELLGDKDADFEVVNSVERTSYVGSELWELNLCKRGR